MFRADPKSALEHVFTEAEKTLFRSKLLWTSCNGTDGQTYGSFKPMTRELLKDRQYRIEFWDGMVSIHFTDVVYDHRTHSHRRVDDDMHLPQERGVRGTVL